MGVHILVTFILSAVTLVFCQNQYTSPVFHRTFSSGCIQSSILIEADCPLVSGKTQWSRPQQSAESDTKFMAISDSKQTSRKCYSKLLVYTQRCSAIPKCVMTTYKYNLPRPPRNVDPSTCSEEWSTEDKCKANGPGGTNTRAVYFLCFNRGARSFCGIKFESCEPERCFKWTKYQRQCYAECNTTSFAGIAMKFVRNCKECDGEVVDPHLCKGGKESSTQLRRCVRKSRAKINFPDCPKAETTVSSTAVAVTTTMVRTSPRESTAELRSSTKEISRKTRSPTKTTAMLTQVITTTLIPRQKTTTPIETKPTIISQTTKTAKTKPQKTPQTESNIVNQSTKPKSTSSEQTSIPNQTTSKRKGQLTEKVPASTTTKAVKSSDRTTSEVVTARTANKKTKSIRQTPTGFDKQSSTPSRKRTETRNPIKTAKDQRIKPTEDPKSLGPRIFSPLPADTTTQLLQPNKTTGDHDKQHSYKFDLVTIAGGAGAGIMFLFLITVIVVLLTKRRDKKTGPDFSLSSSSLRSKTKSAIVDSSSFRIATWIRERPSVRRDSNSSFDSAVSDAEYWRVGGSSDDNTVTNTPEQPSVSKDETVPDIVKAVPVRHTKDEHIYDNIDDVRADVTPQAKKSVHASVNDSRDNLPDVESPSSESTVYAVVHKDARKDSKKRPIDSASNGPRPKLALEPSTGVTRLNGRQLKEGVLQIEFDEKEGVRCRLSNSNVYMNLEETEPPPVI